MKILIVEDVAFRQEFIKGKITSGEVDCTKYAEEGLDLLEKNSYDLVFLDHDLIGAQSGSYLARTWSERKENFLTQKPIVIIHSMNMPGAAKMENYLKGISKKTAIIPFKFILTEEVNLMERIEALKKE